MTLRDRLEPYTMGDEKAGPRETAVVWMALVLASWAVVFALILAVWWLFS